MKADPKPEIEHFKRFYLLDLMSARHLNYLREKSTVVNYREGAILFRPPRSESMGYYLLEGEVKIEYSGAVQHNIFSGTSASYHSLEEELPKDAVATASSECRVLQVSRLLVEQYFSWSNTGTYKAVDISVLRDSEESRLSDWTQPLLNSPLAKNLKQEDAQAFFSLFSELRVRDGNVLINKGENSRYFYIIKRGEARMTRANNEERPLSVGSFFGEESLIPDAASSMQVEMISEGVIARLDKKNFDEYIKKSLIQKVSKHQIQKLPEFQYQLLDVRFPAEFKAGHEHGAVNIPINKLIKRCVELDSGRLVFLTVESGARGELAAYILQRRGYRAFVMDLNESSDQAKLQA